MRNILHKQICSSVALQIHVEPLPITLNKSKNDATSENYCVKIKLVHNYTKSAIHFSFSKLITF